MRKPRQGRHKKQKQPRTSTSVQQPATSVDETPVLICGGQPFTMADLLDEIEEIMGPRSEKRYTCSQTGKINYQRMREDGYPVSIKSEQQFLLIYPEVYEALMVIKRFSPMGNWLVEKAFEMGLTFSLCEDKSSLGSYGGRHVKVSSENSVALNVSILAHEIFHGVQQSRGSLILPGHFNFRCQAAHELSTEAAAQTCAIRVAFEAKLNGYAEAFDYFDTSAETQAEARYAALYHEFAHAFRRKTKEGATQEEALQAATDYAYQAYLDHQGMRDAYNSIVLSRYVRRVADNPSKLPESGFTKEDAYKRCQIDDERSLISEAKCPETDRELFGSNKLLRQAFEFAEYKHLMSAARGRDQSYLQKALAKAVELEDDKNPYWQRRDKINFKKVMRTYDAQDRVNVKPPRFIEVLNDAAGIENETQLTLNFFYVASAAQKAKPQPRMQLCLPAPVRFENTNDYCL